MLHYLLFAINGLLMIALPLIMATFVARRYRAEWGLFGAGAATFVASQLLHIPFNAFVEARYLPEVTDEVITLQLVLVALFYGLSAGVFEELARYVTYRFWRRDARSWSQGLMVGAGHGGIEAIILGLLFIVNTSVVLGIGRGYFTELVPADLLPEVQTQAAALLALPWYEKLLGGVERGFSILVHLALSLMVMRSVRFDSGRWLLLAIVWHALSNAAALITIVQFGALVAELIIGLFALLSLWLIYQWRDQIIEEAEVGAAPPHLPLIRLESQEIERKLDESRYV